MKILLRLNTLFLVLFLTACAGTNAPSATPIDVNALQTAAVQTIVAGITQTVESAPTAEQVVPTETPTPAEVVSAETSTPESTVVASPAASPTKKLCDDAVFVIDTSVQDGTVMTAGQDFVKTWRIKNTGTCTWGTGYKLTFAYGEKLGGVDTNLTAQVLPGNEVEISIGMKAPSKTGNFSGYWRMANNNGITFGQRVSVIIIVP